MITTSGCVNLCSKEPIITIEMVGKSSVKYGNLSDIFLGIQGEGLWVGKRQLFIRFSGCNLRCKFCDTKYAQTPSRECLFFGERLKNPINALWLKEKIKDINFHSISLTGGEPLLQIDFLKEFLVPKEYIVYLDTNGSLPFEFEKIKDLIDLVCMDIKLPSSTRQRPLWDEHKKFLIQAKDIFVKMVITEETEEDDFLYGVEVVNDISSKIPLVLQSSKKGLFDRLFYFQEKALKKLSDVRIVPQVHKVFGIK
ncbi:TPA: 7-carboxy-7-deazaguanine synthase QueE [bacterium]|nr:7-carboxy-7-deazaguanine synthase QueE [bacterium]